MTPPSGSVNTAVNAVSTSGLFEDNLSLGLSLHIWGIDAFFECWASAGMGACEAGGSCGRPGECVSVVGNLVGNHHSPSMAWAKASAAWRCQPGSTWA